MLHQRFTHIKANNSHCAIAKKIIVSVLNEYGLGGETHHTDNDLEDIEKAYAGGYFGMIQNKNEEFVGTFGLYFLDKNVCEIRKMYLLPSARGKGIGKWMVSFLIKKAKELNFKKIKLETSSALKEANGLYLKMGFESVIPMSDAPRCDRAFEYIFTS